MNGRVDVKLRLQLPLVGSPSSRMSRAYSQVAAFEKSSFPNQGSGHGIFSGGTRAPGGRSRMVPPGTGCDGSKFFPFSR